MHSARCGRSATSTRTRRKGASTDAANLEPEWPQRAADLVLVVADLVDQELAAGEERPRLLALTGLTCTLLNHPERTSCAIERASLRSVLLCDIAEIAALACRVSCGARHSEAR
jgi:hypothetical protein